MITIDVLHQTYHGHKEVLLTRFTVIIILFSSNNCYNLTILCLYSSDADEIATSQLFCKLDALAGFKRQNLQIK